MRAFWGFEFPLNIQSQPHSEVPQEKEDWPTLSAILDFKSRVRQRLLKVYNDIASGRFDMTRKVGRVLFMTWEHESYHSEVSNEAVRSQRIYSQPTLDFTVHAPPHCWTWDIASIRLYSASMERSY